MLHDLHYDMICRVNPTASPLPLSASYEIWSDGELSSPAEAHDALPSYVLLLMVLFKELAPWFIIFTFKFTIWEM